MILRRYGTKYHSVASNFNPAAMTEIGFQRDRAFAISAADFDAEYEHVETLELTAKADGEVQGETERTLLQCLDEALANAVSGLPEDQVLVIASGRDDWPKTRERREIVLDGLDNRFHFHYWVEPALDLAVFRRRKS